MKLANRMTAGQVQALISIEIAERKRSRVVGNAQILKNVATVYPTASRGDFIKAAVRHGFTEPFSLRSFNSSRDYDVRTYKVGLAADGREI